MTQTLFKPQRFRVICGTTGWRKCASGANFTHTSSRHCRPALSRHRRRVVLADRRRNGRGCCSLRAVDRNVHGVPFTPSERLFFAYRRRSGAFCAFRSDHEGRRLVANFESVFVSIFWTLSAYPSTVILLHVVAPFGRAGCQTTCLTSSSSVLSPQNLARFRHRA